MALLKQLQIRTLFMNVTLNHASLYVYLRMDLNEYTGLE